MVKDVVKDMDKDRAEALPPPVQGTDDEETEVETEAEEEGEEGEPDTKDSAEAKRALQGLSRPSDDGRSSAMGGGDKDTLFFLNKKTAFEAKMDRRKKVLAIMKVAPEDVTTVADAFDIEHDEAKRYLQANAGDLERTLMVLTSLSV